ncbi:MAG: hypothetical protein H6838_11535 [Planctomycetes bacterium]|nr:hypothetical protein [Planctomycetota bacterium]
MQYHPRLAIVAVALSAPWILAQAPQHLVVPAAHSTSDAPSQLWIPGANNPVRQQTIVGAAHLQALQGHSITAIELRRTAKDRAFPGGSTNITVTLSTSPRQPLAMARTFADNVGGDAAVVFSGTVALPASPAELGPTVAWSPANTVRIALQNPFAYVAGPLCIDVTGAPIAGQTTDDWLADAAFEDLSGAVVEFGAGCGNYAGNTGAWSSASERSLVPGCAARFRAYGTPGGLAIAAFGAPAAGPMPLSAFGVPAPGCAVHLDPTQVLATTLHWFEPQGDPLLAARGGVAEAFVQLPGDPWLFGLTLATQWFDLAQPATSNALQWTVAAQLPTLDMAFCEGHPSQPQAEVVAPYRAHVLRFEFQ